jgi:Flp pilus assembly protein TadG
MKKLSVPRMRQRSARRGFVLVTLTLSVIALVGFLGLAVDLGRVYIVKNELQTFTDSAALSAAIELNGLQSGVDRAVAAVAASQNRWNFATQQVTSTQRTVTFAPTKTGDGNGNWWSSPSVSQIPQIKYVRITVTVPVPLLFMQVVGAGNTQNVAAMAMAGRELTPTVGAGNLLPFSPIAPTPTDLTNFGFVIGNSYTLRWSSNIGNNGAPPNGSTCSGDLALGWGAGTPIAKMRDTDPHRGYWGSQSGSDLSDWIENGYPNAVAVGDTIYMATGTKNGRKKAMEDRVDSDSDNTSTAYATYESRVFASGFRIGNGRRLVAVPINSGVSSGGGSGNSGSSGNGNGNGNGGKNNGNGNGNGGGSTGGSSSGESGSMDPRTVLGFAAFFLNDTDYDDTNGNEPFCAQYVGTYVQGANSHSGGTAGVAKLRLVQ